jgi:hypothetical protein
LFGSQTDERGVMGRAARRSHNVTASGTYGGGIRYANLAVRYGSR